MVKVITKRATGLMAKDPSWNKERIAVKSLSAKSESFAFRETKAADIPVTYVSGQSIIQECGGERKVIGEVAPRVKIGRAK